MNPKDISRREFLKLMGIGGGAALLNGCLPARLTALRFPPAAIPAAFTPDVEIALRAVEGEEQILPGKATRVRRYQAEVIKGPAEAARALPDSYLGPVFTLQRGQRVRVHFNNELPEESVVHWHGLHVPPEADGHPRLAIQPGETYVYNFTVADRAGTYWFHPHPHGRTGPQVYAGLAGLFVIHDDEETGLGLPSGKYDVPLVIQDRTFDGDNQLVYDGQNMMGQMVGFLGNRVLVNGQPDFTLPAVSGAYRLRLLNGSNSRIYKLGWEDGTPLTVIGTDGGLLEKPLQKEYITFAPAQRVDLWANFSGRADGDQPRLVNQPSAAPGGDVLFPVLRVKVDRLEDSAPTLPERLPTIRGQVEGEAANRSSPRSFALEMGRMMRWTINGRTFEMMETARDEVVRLGDLEVWQFTNQTGGGMGMMGGGMELPPPMHIHGLQFQVLERQVNQAGRAAWETLSDGFVDEGWHDTVLVMPGESVKILLKFEDFTGLYLYHCHNLEHEDMGMMRNYRVEV